MEQLHVPITGLYAALQGLIAIALTFPVGSTRGKLNVSIGDGGNEKLGFAIRRHANWTEHVPFALLLIGLLELNGGGPNLLHGLGIGLLASRIAHPFGLQPKLNSVLRIVGAGGTGLVTLVAIVALLVKFANG